MKIMLWSSHRTTHNIITRRRVCMMSILVFHVCNTDCHIANYYCAEHHLSSLKLTFFFILPRLRCLELLTAVIILFLVLSSSSVSVQIWLFLVHLMDVSEGGVSLGKKILICAGSLWDVVHIADYHENLGWRGNWTTVWGGALLGELVLKTSIIDCTE